MLCCHLALPIGAVGCSLIASLTTATSTGSFDKSTVISKRQLLLIAQARESNHAVLRKRQKSAVRGNAGSKALKLHVDNGKRLHEQVVSKQALPLIMHPRVRPHVVPHRGKDKMDAVPGVPSVTTRFMQ